MEISDAQFAQFVDRIMACRDAEDAAKEDTKRVYAEANDAGADKTALGLFVRAERMDGKQRSKANLRDATVDDYRERYRRGKASHVRVREEASENTTNIPSKSGRDSAKSAAAVTTPDHDPETGEITEPQPETAVQMHHSDEAAELPASEEGHTSLAGAEGIDDRHPITEQQSSPEAARDLAVPALNGQVATHTLETANEADGDVLGHAVQPVAADHSIPAVIAETTEGGPHESAAHPESVIDPGRRPDDLKSHSAGGQTNEAVNTSAHIAAGEGAPIASAASLYAEPGEVVMESCPPVGIVTHPYAACWPVNTVNVEDGIRQPIVKIGNLILDGRGRYFAARAAHVEYPVVQYAGDDDLADSIAWNLASRPGMDPRALRIVAEKLAKLVPDRAEEIMERFGFNEEQRAAQ